MFEKYADGYLYREVECNGGVNLELKPGNQIIQINYNTMHKIIDNIKPKETAVIVDLSFAEGTKYVIDHLKSLDCKIIWIDHHKSSIELQEEYPELKEIKGIRDASRSGAWLTWTWFSNPSNAFAYGVTTKNKFYSTRIKSCPVYPEKAELTPRTITYNSPVPLFVVLTDDYDRWVNTFSESKELNLAHSMYGMSPKCNFWYHLFLGYLSFEMEVFSERCDECQNADNEDYVNRIKRYLRDLKLANDTCLGISLNKGETMLYYDIKTKRMQWHSGGFMGFVKDINGNRYRAAILNIRSNSDCFPPEVLDEYDVVSVYNFNGGETSVGKFKYSFYSSHDEVDCSAIAKYYSESGGGHAGAAGCYSNEFIYEDYGPIVI